MNKRSDLLDKLKICLKHGCDPPKSFGIKNLEVVEELFKTLGTYYMFKDLEMETHYYDIFRKLYVDEETHTFDDIALKIHISLSTLERCRLAINSFAKKIIAYLTEKSQSAP